MADERGKEVIRRWQRLKGDRGTLETQWQEIAELVRPMRADFTVQRMQGERRGLQIFDNTAGVAAENLAAGLWSMVTNSANEWFRLKHPVEELDREQDVREWLDECTRRMRAVFAAGGQRFYSAALECYMDLVCFGTAPFFVAESKRPGRLFFSARSVAECVIAQDDEEIVDTVIRRFEWTARQVAEHSAGTGGKFRIPKSVQEALDGDKEDQPFWFLHAVEPNPDADPRRRGKRGMAFRSLYISERDSEVVQEGGFSEFPFMVPRWSTTSRGLYGDSAAMLALADTKTLQAQERTQMVAAQKAADPPLLAPDENVLRSIRTTPGGIIYGAVGPDGNPLVRPLETRGAFQLTEVMTQQKRDAIRTALYASLLTMVANPGATATEVLARQEEQLRQMAPHLGRLTAEFHDPLIGRVFGLMWQAGMLPPPPEALREAPELQVEYVSPLARAQRSSEAGAIMRTLEAVLPLAQADPSVLMVFDLPEVARTLAEALGMPAKAMRSPEEVQRMQAEAQQAQAQMQQMQMLTAAAPAAAQGAKAVRDFTAAQIEAEGAA